MPDTDKYKNTLGSLVVSYLSNEELEISESQFFLLLNKAILQIINKARKVLGLRKENITEHQIESTKKDLLSEIITEPSKYETLEIEVLADNVLKEEEKKKKISLINISKHVSSIIRDIAESEDNPAAIIYTYLLKRTITLLKQYAEITSKKYFLLLNNVRKAIDSLKKDDMIYESIKGRYSSIKKETAIFNSKNCYVTVNFELENELNKVKYNIKKIVIAFLKSNYNYNFSLKDICSYIAAIVLNEKGCSDTVKTFNDSNKQEEHTPKIEEINKSDFSANITALDTMKEILLCHSSSKKSYIQREMALLAYLYRTVPAYFTEKILTNEQLELEETKCIENFLNDKRFCRFNKSKTVGRTTAFYRKAEGINALKNLLSDLSAEAQSIFIKKYADYLEKRYREVIGVKHEK